MSFEFLDEPPRTGSGRYAHYEHSRSAGPNWEFCDVRAAIDRNREEWLDALAAWHVELCRRAAKLTPRWWLTAGSRLTAWYPADLKPVLFAAGAVELLGSESVPLSLVGCPPDVREYLEEWRTGRCPENLALLPQPGAPPSPGRLLLNSAARVLGAPFSGPKLGKARVLVFSYSLRGDILASQDDHYFGDALDALPGFKPEDILWIYYLEYIRERRDVLRFIKRRERRGAFYFDVLGLADFIGIRTEARRTLKDLEPLGNDLPPLRLGRLTSAAFSRRFFRDIVQVRAPILELGVTLAFKRLLDRTRADAVVFPYEEKGIERAILAACREAGRPIRTIGYAHAAYNDCHLYLRARPPEASPPRPDLIAVTGTASGRWLREVAELPGERVRTVGSPRHTGLGAAPRRAESRRLSLRALAVAGHGFEVGLLANLIEEEPGLFDGCELLLRKYPYGWGERQERDAGRLAKLLPGARIEVGELDEQIRWCDVILFASTSAGIHCMLRGRPAVHLALHDALAADPTQGAGNAAALLRCATGRDLKQTLARLRGMTDEEYRAAADAQRGLAEEIYAPLDRRGFAEAISP